MCILHPFCAAAWSFDKILKSPLSFDHASLLGSSRFCLRDWNSCSVPSFFVTPFSQIITPPSVTFDRNCCMICLPAASPALPLPFSFFGSMCCPSVQVSDLSNIYSHSHCALQNAISDYGTNQLYHKQKCESKYLLRAANPYEPI